MLLRWVERIRRWQWVDWLLVRLESYTALLEQYPPLKTAIRIVVAAVLAAWTYFGESWLPLAILVGLGGFVALSFLPAAIRQGSTNPSAAGQQPPQPDEPRYVADPEALALDKPAYNDLVVFCMDALLPACSALTAFQDSILKSLCENELVVEAATKTIREEDKVRGFWNNYDNLNLGLMASPGPSITFEDIIEYVHGLEGKGYLALCEQTLGLIKSAGPNCIIQVIRYPEWTEWRYKHFVMIESYPAIARDIRFGKLHRLRPARWGDPDFFTQSG